MVVVVMVVVAEAGAGPHYENSSPMCGPWSWFCLCGCKERVVGGME